MSQKNEARLELMRRRLLALGKGVSGVSRTKPTMTSGTLPGLAGAGISIGRKLKLPKAVQFGSRLGRNKKGTHIEARQVTTVKNVVTLFSHSKFRSPAWGIAKAIQNALDPVRAPGKVKTLADMTPEEIKHLEETYRTKILPPKEVAERERLLSVFAARVRAER